MSTRREAALRAELLSHAPRWRAAAARAARLAGARRADAAQVLQLAPDYGALAHDLARARQVMPASRTREHLEGLYARCHATLHHAPFALASLRELFRRELPAVVRALTPQIAASVALFALAVLAGFALVHRYPELIALFASPDLIASVDRGQLWTEGLLNVVPSSVLAAQILTNNIIVSLFAWCAGFLFGLGTVYILGLNGLMLGAVFAYTSLHGLGFELLRFILPHGPVEVSVMCLSGAAGAAVGEAIVRPQVARAESFRRAVLSSGVLLVPCVLLLVGCGVIEGYVSPRPGVPPGLRAAIGLGFWLCMLALLCGWPRARPSPGA